MILECFPPQNGFDFADKGTIIIQHFIGAKQRYKLTLKTVILTSYFIAQVLHFTSSFLQSMF